MTTIPTDADTTIARTILQALMPLQGANDVPVTIADRQLSIPAVMMPALVAAAKLISEGHAIDVVAADQEVSAQDAADLLSVSRPYLLNLVKKGILPCRMVGAHHRIPVAAVIAYKRDQAPRRQSLEVLSAETQDIGH